MNNYEFDPSKEIKLEKELTAENAKWLLHDMAYYYWKIKGGEEGNLVDVNIEQLRDICEKGIDDFFDPHDIIDSGLR